MAQVIKIISGGQIGADQAGLEFARRHGIATGGMCPAGYRTADGPMPGLLGELYGLQPTNAYGYKNRTYLNVSHSCGTIIFCRNCDSPGTRCTMNACNTYARPLLMIPVLIPYRITPQVAMEWLEENNIKVLNIAGNRTARGTDIFNFVIKFLVQVFAEKD